jgi:hypothetical protein
MCNKKMFFFLIIVNQAAILRSTPILFIKIVLMYAIFIYILSLTKAIQNK